MSLALAILILGVVAVGWALAPAELTAMLGFVAWKRLPWNAPSKRGVPSGDVVIHTESYGEGDPVVVLHCGFGLIEVMANQIRPLAGGRRVIAIDTRGHGRSTDGAGALTYEQMADDASSVLAALGIPRAQVVGWSDGATTALLLAIHHPEQVVSVIAISPNASPDALTAEAQAEVRTLGTEHPMIKSMGGLYKLTSPSPDRFPAFVEKMVFMIRHEPHITAEQLGTIRAPTLIVGAEHDQMPHEHLRWLAASIPGAEVRITKGTKHEQPLRDPKQVNAEMMDWLDRHG
jgi:pimeloyl-ACP methyl ester carboxylesterase